MKRTKRDLTMAESRQAMLWVETLTNILGCAGEPACEAEQGGESCTGCAAREWIDKLRERGRKWAVRGEC